MPAFAVQPAAAAAAVAAVGDDLVWADWVLAAARVAVVDCGKARFHPSIEARARTESNANWRHPTGTPTGRARAAMPNRTASFGERWMSQPRPREVHSCVRLASHATPSCRVTSTKVVQ